MKRGTPKRRRDRKSGVSPYQKYGKTPYPYSFRNCRHNTRIRQQTPSWSGLACSSCGTIIDNFTKRESDSSARMAAE